MMRAVIFDLDGVLVSTDHFHYKAWKQIADRLNIPFDEDVNNRLRGVSRMESLDIILSGASDKQFTDEQKRSLAEEKNTIYRKFLEQLSPADILPGVTETLEGLKVKGVAAAVGSSSKNARFILEQVGLLDWFAVVVDGNQILRSKPDPEVFLLAASQLECDASACLVVEDAVAGVQAGVHAGMEVAAVGDAVNSKEATFTLQRIDQLLKLI
ncbi:beta-phosphoglucomutase [Paenibacillus sp. FSL H7-0737]|uniref:beta-phosphoglucomutase n=1 Tax=Paenibacillus sp. FSL H7-0737 TaxID=1536775 RepID=UPI0004F5EFB1|nr:beta-phosphoglucomutase [Paenibacillus sp. FSL H7-0737]AIQ21951.1 beta-phosphoglucomutase [Paenibacillus sp. FSL H7-0737]